VVFDAILFQELNELVPKKKLPMMLLLSGNVSAYRFNIRLTYSECTVARAFARFAGFEILKHGFLGFRFAPPQALC